MTRAADLEPARTTQPVSLRLSAALDRHATAACATVVVLVTAASLAIAIRRPLWSDELFTYYFASLPGFGDVWRELSTGVEQTPPLFYALTRTASGVLGDGNLAWRVWEVLGFALAVACTFAFVRRRAPTVYALLAAVLPTVTSAFYFASEARPYALVLGFGAMALLCWQRAADRQTGRRRALVGLGFALALACATHYYAVLLLVPLGAGEATRLALRGRVDWPLAGALAAGLLPLLPAAPLMASAQQLSTTFWARPSWLHSLDLWYFLLDPRALWAPVLAVIGAGLVCAVRGTSMRSVRRRGMLGLPPHEVAAVTTLLLLPQVGVVLAMLLTGAFAERYALPAVLGLSVLLAVAARAIDGRRRLVGLLLLACASVAAAAEAVSRYEGASAEERARAARLVFLADHGTSGLPIAMSGPFEFFASSHDAAEAGTKLHLVYLADPVRAVRRVGTDTPELGLLELRRFAPLTVTRYERFVAQHGHFLMYGEHGRWSWAPEQLRADGWRLTVRARHDDDVLYDVRRGRVRP